MVGLCSYDYLHIIGFRVVTLAGKSEWYGPDTPEAQLPQLTLTEFGIPFAVHSETLIIPSFFVHIGQHNFSLLLARDNKRSQEMTVLIYLLQLIQASTIFKDNLIQELQHNSRNRLQHLLNVMIMI